MRPDDIKTITFDYYFTIDEYNVYERDSNKHLYYTYTYINSWHYHTILVDALLNKLDEKRFPLEIIVCMDD